MEQRRIWLVAAGILCTAVLLFSAIGCVPAGYTSTPLTEQTTQVQDATRSESTPAVVIGDDLRSVNGYVIEVHGTEVKIVSFEQMPPWWYDSEGDSGPFVLTLPEELDGCKVVALGSNFITSMWYSQGGIDTIVLPKTLKQIDPGAFEGTWGDFTLQVDADSPYLVCENGMLMNRDRTELIFCAYDVACDSNGEVLLPDTIERIDRGACGNCGICVIPPNVNRIEEGAFSYGSTMKTYHSNVRLKDPEASDEFRLDNDILLNAEGTLVISINNTKQNALRIPEGVARIGYAAGTGLPVTFIVFPISLRSIGEEAFSDCSSIENLSFAEGLKEIEDNAFCNNCRAPIQEILLPDSIERIGDGAFAVSSNLMRVHLPSNLKSLGYGAFENFWTLSKLELPQSIETMDGLPCSYEPSELKTKLFGFPTEGMVLENGLLMNAERTELIGTIPSDWNDQNGKFSLPEGIRAISCSYLARGASDDLQEVILPDSLVEIGDYACAYFPNTDFLSLSGSIQKIGDYAFYEAKMDVLVLEKGISQIGTAAFSTCRTLNTVQLPGSLRVIPNYAFQNCQSLSKIVIAEGVEQIGYAAFQGCGSLTEVHIPASVKRIDDFAFFECGQDGEPLKLYYTPGSYAEQYVFAHGYAGAAEMANK